METWVINLPGRGTGGLVNQTVSIPFPEDGLEKRPVLKLICVWLYNAAQVAAIGKRKAKVVVLPGLLVAQTCPP